MADHSQGMTRGWFRPQCPSAQSRLWPVCRLRGQGFLSLGAKSLRGPGPAIHSSPQRRQRWVRRGISSGSGQAGWRHRSSPSADRLSDVPTARIPAAILHVRDPTAWPDAQAAICERAAPERLRSGGCALAKMTSWTPLDDGVVPRSSLLHPVESAGRIPLAPFQAQCRTLRTCVVKTHEHAAANVKSVLLVSECPRAGGERDRVAVRPGAECSRVGYRMPPLAVMNSAVKHSVKTCGGSWPRFNDLCRGPSDDRRPTLRRSVVSFYGR